MYIVSRHAMQRNSWSFLSKDLDRPIRLGSFPRFIQPMPTFYKIGIKGKKKCWHRLNRVNIILTLCYWNKITSGIFCCFGVPVRLFNKLMNKLNACI
jgi:hypothetical protein